MVGLKYTLFKVIYSFTMLIHVYHHYTSKEVYVLIGHVPRNTKNNVQPVHTCTLMLYVKIQ